MRVYTLTGRKWHVAANSGFSAVCGTFAYRVIPGKRKITGKCKHCHKIAKRNGY